MFTKHPELGRGAAIDKTCNMWQMERSFRFYQLYLFVRNLFGDQVIFFDAVFLKSFERFELVNFDGLVELILILLGLNDFLVCLEHVLWGLNYNFVCDNYLTIFELHKTVKLHAILYCLIKREITFDTLDFIIGKYLLDIFDFL